MSFIFPYWMQLAGGRQAPSLPSRLQAAAGGAANVTAAFLYGVNAIVSGGVVSSWGDAAGGALALAGTGTQRPSDNGTEYVFDGSANALQTATVTENQPVTLFLVVKQIAWAANAYLADGTSGDTMAVYQTPITPQVHLYAGVDSASISPTLGTWFVITAVANGASSSLQASDATAVTGNYGTNNPGGLTIGSKGNMLAGTFSSIAVRAAVVCPVAVTAQQKADIKALLYAAYGVSP